MPHTAEGQAALGLLLSPGAWTYAGMSGVAVGVDFEAAMMRLVVDPVEIDTHGVRELLLIGEGAALKAMAERHENDEGEQ
jgi:hypothetical protein